MVPGPGEGEGGNGGGARVRMRDFATAREVAKENRTSNLFWNVIHLLSFAEHQIMYQVYSIATYLYSLVRNDIFHEALSQSYSQELEGQKVAGKPLHIILDAWFFVFF